MKSSMKREIYKQLRSIVIISVGLALIPPILQFNNYFLLVLTYILLYAVIVSAWNIIGGFGGQLDLGAGAFTGLGCFTMGTLLLRWNIPPVIGVFAGGLIAAAFGFIIGYPSFRFGLKDVWYALATIALVVVLKQFFTVWEQVGGPEERYLPGTYGSLYYLKLPYSYYYYILVVALAIVLFLNVKVKMSKLGYYLFSVRENEDAAEMLGVDVRMTKLKGLMIYAFITGTIGSFFALISGYIHPTQFNTDISLQIAILGIVGGLGSIYSPVITTFILQSASEYLRTVLGGWIPGIHLIFYGAILMIIVLFFPEGLSAILNKVYAKIGLFSLKKEEKK